ncbi:alanine--glyoxylate aminotransferase family protein [Oceanobacillus piezotolerans]|uniref:Alanine--glyoxylate aminotransferase family protein n=1 Tax=Oceanobacillus piezotolerans TaxID=2448030 RepID=A0A498DQK7_9BACI|nr:alanine--glyoxylate aminotransferase family protein [Oceanobacillus piezotolerans]RLL46769.1 alanine--glyoxylate aminotransferase family protein [Oceanobacillus piezotolerans]
MLPDHQLLRIPGPSPIPPSVTRAMSQPMIGHRAQETKNLLKDIKPRLKRVFGTEQDVLILSGSGTAGLETAVANTVKPGEEVLVLVTGAFGDRFTKICDAYGIKVHRLEVTWGEAVNPEELKSILIKHPNISVVFSTYCETSTGVLNPVDKLAKVVHDHSDALIVVDGVSCVGGVETKMDEWDIDILVTGSQKAFMLPAGLTFVAVSERAWKVIEENEQSRFYFNLKKYRDSLEEDSTPFTPALSLLFGLQQVLNLFEEEGLEEVYRRHSLMKDMTRAAIKALGIPLLTNDEAASPTVTAVKPEDFDAEALRKVLKKEFGLSIAGGQQHLKGRIFRIGHMGYCSPADVLQILGILEIGLIKVGKEVKLGEGVKAAQEIYLQQEAQV